MFMGLAILNRQLNEPVALLDFPFEILSPCVITFNLGFWALIQLSRK